MVRKEVISEKKQKVRFDTPAGTNSISEGVVQPEDANPLVRDEHPKVANASMEKVKSYSRKGAKSANLSSQRKKAKYQTAIVRRSDRIRNIIRPASNMQKEPVIENITLSDSDQEDEQHADMEEELQETTLCEESMEEKIDYIVQLLEYLEDSVETLKFKNKNSFLSGIQTMTYKSLYVDSWNKIESLTKENHQLSKQLEVVLAKLEVYEKGQFGFSELMEKLKDSIILGNLTVATDTAVNRSTGVIHNTRPSEDYVREPGTEAKRKRGKQRKM